MHPIWGPRCIGIQEQDYCYWELHVLTHVSVAWVDFGTTFAATGIAGPNGFNFNPCLWFVKDVIYKQARKFARRHPVWVDSHPHSYNLVHRREIESQFQERWRNGAKFVSAALDPDTANTLRARQRELFVLFAGQCLRRPVSTAQSTWRWLGRKLAALRSASVPVIEVDTPMESRELRQCLLEKLGHAFQPIEVAERPLPIAVRISLQARQSLLIVYRKRTEKAPPAVSNYRIPIPRLAEQDIAAAVAAILDRIFDFNSEWAARYRERAQA